MKSIRPPKRRRFQVLWIGFGLLALCSIIPLRLAIAWHQAPAPQAILVLEGSSDRVQFAAQFAKSHPDLLIWVSGNPNGLFLNKTIFRRAGIPEQQVRYDFCATDTVTNFTCNADTFANQNIQHIYLITADFHMLRSLSIAAIVLGSRGIFATPVSVPSQHKLKESPFKIVRDCLRSLVWILTGYTGANLRYRH